MEWLNFRHLYSFWMVCKLKSFTKAAQEMRVAQSAVSDQVSQLETYLGESLLRRSTRSLAPTEAGHKLFEYAQIIFSQSREINTFIRDKELPTSMSNLRIGIIGGASRNFIYRLISDFTKVSPTTLVDVRSGSFVELNEQLKKSELDVILAMELPTKTDLEDYTFQKVGQTNMCMAGTKRLVNSVRRKRRKKPLDIHSFIHPDTLSMVDDYVRPQFNVELNQALKTDDIPLLRFFANHDDGVAIIPQIGILDDIEDGSVDYIPIKNCPEVNIYGIFLKGSTHQKTIELFLD